VVARVNATDGVAQLTGTVVVSECRFAQDAEVATQYKADKKKFENTAKYWTESYATPKKKEEMKDAVNAKIAKLSEMGFDKKKCAEALEKTKGDENAAVEWLMNH